MKIVSIFAGKLFAFHYDGGEENEYDRLMDLWTDVEFIRDYATINDVPDVRDFVENIMEDAEYIQDLMDDVSEGIYILEEFFMPLNDLETGAKVLSLQKGKRKRSLLRLYAIRIDENLFVVTGGAIKLANRMQDHPDTNEEKNKLEKARNYLKDSDVCDEDSFFELLNNE